MNMLDEIGSRQLTLKICSHAFYGYADGLQAVMINQDCLNSATNVLRSHGSNQNEGN